MVPAWSHKPNDTGSNPVPATTASLEAFFWSVHLRVRIQDFHSCHRGSNPLPTTKTIKGPGLPTNPVWGASR